MAQSILIYMVLPAAPLPPEPVIIRWGTWSDDDVYPAMADDMNLLHTYASCKAN